MCGNALVNANQAMQAENNGSWYNTRVSRDQIWGPVSGDAITKQIAYGAAHKAVAEAAVRPALEIAAR